MKYQVELLMETQAEMLPLLMAHWDEVALDKDTIKPNGNWEIYAMLEEQGTLSFTTVRSDEGELFGYILYIIHPLMHYKHILSAECDLYFMVAAHRKGMAGYKLLKRSEDDLVERGVNKVFNRVKLHLDVGPVFERLGYTAIERVYAKGLM